LVNRLQDLRYRVQTLHETELLASEAERDRPLIVLADMSSGQDRVLEAIRQLRQQAATSHIPVIAFCREPDAALAEAARQAGATLVATEAAISHHLSQLLEQALTEF
jgi:PleD family two-component response regulator